MQIGTDAGMPWWLFGSAAERLETVLALVPSAETYQALTVISAEQLTAAERVLVAQAWDRQISSVQAAAMTALVDAATPGGTDPLSQQVLDVELALALRRSEMALSGQLAFARRLHDLLPVTARLLAEGDVTLAHAKAIDELTVELSDEDTRWVDAEVAHRAAQLTPSAFRRVVRRAVAACKVDQDRRRDNARKATKVQLWPEPHGMATVAATMAAADAVSLMDALNAAADRSRVPDDPRSHGERQVDGLLGAVLGGEPRGEGTVRARRRSELKVTIDWASLLGLRDNPGELAGYGPIPAWQVRELLREEGTVLRRVVYDEVTGVLLDLGRRYPADAGLRSLVESRDVTCRFPGCTRNAIWCDLEHRQAYDAGGDTSCANCGLACRKHHRCKTHDGFNYQRPDPATGETVWSTPLGFPYRQAAATYTPIGTDTGNTTREPMRRHVDNDIGPDDTS